MTKMNIEYWKTEDVNPYENNPRINDGAVEATANSIKEFGWKQPIVVDKEGVIIAGHTRLKAAKKLGMEEIPVLVAKDLSSEQADAYRLADNKTGEISEWNMDMLGDELSQIEDIDMTDFGFDDEDLELQDENTDAEDDEFDGEIPENPTSKVGDIYKLGEHRLMVGDSTDPGQVKQLMDGEKADLLITDPPYNVDIGIISSDDAKRRHRRTDGLVINNDDMEDNDFRQFLKKSYIAADANMKPGATFYIWHAETERINFEEACNDIGWQVRETLIWNKNSLSLTRQDYQWKHEPCLYGWKDGAPHFWNSDRKQTTVLDFDKPTKSKLHPTMKPVPLFDYQIKNSSKRGQIVLDLFGGSGTTMIACEQNGRKAYLMEIDPKYADVIIDRWEEFTGKKAEKLN